MKSEKIIFLDMKIRRMDDSTEYVKVEEEEIDTDICTQILILSFLLNHFLKFIVLFIVRVNKKLKRFSEMVHEKFHNYQLHELFIIKNEMSLKKMSLIDHIYLLKRNIGHE